MEEFSLLDYAPIGIMFLVAAGFALSQILVGQIIGPRKSTATKLMPYECGKDPVGSARDRFSIKFYMVAVAFLLFDIEILFVVPFAVAFKKLLGLENQTGIFYGTIAFFTMLFFLTTVIIGLVYEWKKGAFEWSKESREEALIEAQKLKLAKKTKIESELKKAA
ncbi:MAG: NADH-quinone oxidoreductase subunit A [Pyrinomonadaceae bacterium]